MAYNGNRFNRMSGGDWICCDTKCASLNFARRNKCFRCHKDRKTGDGRIKHGQEIGVDFANRSKGLFSADDWHCPRCENVNWARRLRCNLCQAPRYTDRHGYGGGYNERETVEYIKHDDSDSEYDDFGRKRRNRKKSDDEESNSTETQGKFDEEGDNLSKYDLDESVGNDKTSNDQSNLDIRNRQANTELKRHRSPSTSRSRSPANRK